MNDKAFHSALCTLHLALALTLAGCSQDMYDQPRLEPLEASRFFDDGTSVRPQIVGTVARDQLHADHPYFTGKNAGEFVTSIPTPPDAGEMRIDRSFVARGRQRFDIFCAPCHGRTGYGDGMVVKRGFPRPPSLHDSRLRKEIPDGQIFDTIRHGFRNMPSYGPQIPAADRWRIVAYVRALQRSQFVPLDEAPADVQRQFEEPPR